VGSLGDQAPDRSSTFSLRHRALWSAFRAAALPPAPGAPADADPRLVYLGDDADGVALEVMAVELEDGSLLVVHAMALREMYREQYEEAKTWRRRRGARRD
jgi:hypothetical protein